MLELLGVILFAARELCSCWGSLIILKVLELVLSNWPVPARSEELQELAIRELNGGLSFHLVLSLTITARVQAGEAELT